MCDPTSGMYFDGMTLLFLLAMIFLPLSLVMLEDHAHGILGNRAAGAVDQRCLVLSLDQFIARRPGRHDVARPHGMAAVDQAAAGIDDVLAPGRHQPVFDQGIGPAQGHQAELRHADLELMDEGIVQLDDVDRLRWGP